MDTKQETKSPRIDTSRVQRICRSTLAIPIGAEVVIHAIDLGIRFQTTFIGLIKNQYLLVHRPEQLRNVNLSPNDQVTVRYIAGSLIFGFSSSLAATIRKPHPILFITHPECYETLNLRQDDRIQCFQPVTVFKDGLELKGKLIDISKHGCKIILDEQQQNATLADLPVQTEIFCTLQLPDSDENLYAKGLIRQIEQQKNKIRLGVQFIDLEENVQNAIEHYIAATMEYLEGE